MQHVPTEFWLCRGRVLLRGVSMSPLPPPPPPSGPAVVPRLRQANGLWAVGRQRRLRNGFPFALCWASGRCACSASRGSEFASRSRAPGTGPFATENQFPCQKLVVRLVRAADVGFLHLHTLQQPPTSLMNSQVPPPPPRPPRPMA